jgi:hypothetical protein
MRIFFSNRSEFIGAASGIKPGLLGWKKKVPGKFVDLARLWTLLTATYALSPVSSRPEKN